MNSRIWKPEIIKRKPRIDYTSKWSRLANRKPRYNRMDPDPDPETDVENNAPVRPGTNLKNDLMEALGLEVNIIETKDARNKSRKGDKKDAGENMIGSMARDYWREFWVGRLRKNVDAPNLTSKEIADAVDRSKRVFLQRRKEDRQLKIDPDLPTCYYWDKYQVAEWAGRLKLPNYIPIKEILVDSEVNGRRLVSLNATNLVKMGIYQLDFVKMITKAVRAILKIPPPNAMRALGRLVPLEQFLLVKVRTGIEVDKLTFKQFCEQAGINYEGAKAQIREGYKPLRDSCRGVVIRPEPGEDINWIPVPVEKNKQRTASSDDSLLWSDEGSSSSDGYLYNIPTVEELVNNAVLREAIISDILNEIVEKVYEATSTLEFEEEEEEEVESIRQQIADGVFNDHMSEVYSVLAITDPVDKLKLITIIAEEFVGDVLRSRDVLEDIDRFQSKIKTKISGKEMAKLQDAVELYVQSVMPLVVSAAKKHLEQSSQSLHPGMKNKAYYDDYDGYGGSAESANEDKHVEVLYKSEYLF